MALLQAADAAEMAAKESLQFHGGYGFVVEYDIHLYLRFIKALGVVARDRAIFDDALPRRLRPVRGAQAETGPASRDRAAIRVGWCRRGGD